MKCRSLTSKPLLIIGQNIKNANNKMMQMCDTQKLSSYSSEKNHITWTTVVRKSDNMRLGFKLII